MGRLDGKVALLSGAARGMGAAEASLFAREGARVVIGDLRTEEGSKLAASIGEDARFVALDVTEETSWEAAVRGTLDAFGRLDVLVNNAGIAEASPLAETSLESYRRVIDVNQVGVFLGMRTVIPAMTEVGGGSILNISSIDGLVGMNGVVSYVASKWAVRGMTKTASIELGPLGIRVNSIHPGFIRTEMGIPDGGDASAVHTLLEEHTARLAPLGRAGLPEEIAALALFLASDESAYCTGSEFTADGGLIAGYPLPGTPT
jgi:3alpha(or 20beta)-hydroxysteroid dehydrogenase